MNKIILSNTELKSLTILLKYLSDSEKKHYEESNKNDKINHIYNHMEIIKSALKI
jgi:hypothetical protein